MALHKKRDFQPDYLRCGIGFILAVIITLPPSIHFLGKFRESTSGEIGRESALGQRSSTFETWVESYNFAALSQPTTTQSTINNPSNFNTVPSVEKVTSQNNNVKHGNSIAHFRDKLLHSLEVTRNDGLTASNVGHSWSLLPCPADQACSKPLLEISPPHHSETSDLFVDWKDETRLNEVSKMVFDLSLDILRQGGTGEARLRGRRHSAYRPDQLNMKDDQKNIRCNSLFKPSSQKQLHKLLSDIRKRQQVSSSFKTESFKNIKNMNSSSMIPQHVQLSRTNFVAFTITDATYGDMLNEVWGMMVRLKLAPYFFYVALDKPTAMAACHHHMPTLMFSEPLSLPDSTALPKRDKKFKSTKDRVYEAKYGIALALTLEKVNFLFFEMDCWILQQPLRAVVNHQIDADIYMSLHQDNPFEFNVGYYYVITDNEARADRTSRFFQATLSYLRTHDDSFDQKLINCLMKFYAHKMDRIYHSLFSRAGCKGQKISMDDPALVALTSKPDQVMRWALFEIDDVLSNAIPLLARDTATLHVLTNVPLTAASGKKVVAKDLMVWEGAYCYYCIGVPNHHDSTGALIPLTDDEVEDRLSPLLSLDDEQEQHDSIKYLNKYDKTIVTTNTKRRRYLAYDGPIRAADFHFLSESESWHQINHVEILASTILQLVALAIYTERILILPIIQHDVRFVRAWEMLDMISAEQFVEWRETSFLRNPRLSVSDDATAARVLIGSEAATFELYRWGSQDVPIQPSQGYQYPKHMKTRGDAMRSVLKESPESEIADLLLISFDREYYQPEQICFRNDLNPCEELISSSSLLKHMKPSSSIHTTSPWITVLTSSMRWCMLDKIKNPQVAGLKALDDCFANTQRSMSKGIAKVTPAWYAIGSDRCLIASLQRAYENEKIGSSALAMAHLLRQKGDGKKTQAALVKQPANVAKFAQQYAKGMKERISNPGKSC